MHLLKFLVEGTNCRHILVHSRRDTRVVTTLAFVQLLNQKRLIDPPILLLEIPGNLQLGFEIHKLGNCSVGRQNETTDVSRVRAILVDVQTAKRRSTTIAVDQHAVRRHNRGLLLLPIREVGPKFCESLLGSQDLVLCLLCSETEGVGAEERGIAL
ncbi:hypothetical protein ASF68_16345 [Plantibacter sp. Leaf314]|nr:hypothetical protein ASF68_16345 [Plantibacter sp. Leaf314]